MMTMNDVMLSVRAANVIERLGIRTVDELVNFDWWKFAKLPKCGKRTIVELAARAMELASGKMLKEANEYSRKYPPYEFDWGRLHKAESKARLWDKIVKVVQQQLMSKDPKRIQLSRKKGWRMPPNTVIVDRRSEFGNPHRVGLCPVCGVHHTAEEAVKEYQALLVHPYGWSAMAERVRRKLRGKNLACWCRIGASCHADVLLEIANRPN